jgi:hypothetical protein
VTEQQSAAEQSAVTAPTVVEGLGYPADRKETSPEPTGWNVSREDRARSSDALSESWTSNEANVSRETLGEK